MENSPYLELKPDELKKVQAVRLRHEQTNPKVDQEWYFIAAFGKHFGWGGVQAILNNEIDLGTANMLMAGARKVDYAHMFEDAQTAFIALGSSNSKKPSNTFESLTKGIRKGMTV